MKPFNPSEIKTIGVFVEKELLGECLLKLPFLQGLRKAFPASHITWMVGIEKSFFSSSLAPLRINLIDTCLEKPFQSKMSWGYLFSKAPDISFDMIINTENNLKKTLILKRIPHRYFICSLYNFFFSTLKQKNTKNQPPVHLTEKLLDLVDVASQKKNSRNNLNQIDLPKSIVSEVELALKESKNYFGISPGAGDPRKCWPLRNFVNIASVQEKKGYSIVWILGPKEESSYIHLKKLRPLDIFPLQEHPEFLQSPLYTIAIGKNLKAALSNDSGTGHLLAASGVPILSLFGHTKAEKVRPFSSSAHWFKSQDFGSKKIEDLPQEIVLKKLDQLLPNLVGSS